jgi:transposase/predicted transcriptional regulator
MANEERMDFAAEFPEGTEETLNTETPVEAIEEASEHTTYTLADGSTGSRAAFIREQFLNENLSRKEIAEKFGFAYRVVYSATVNMTNASEATQRGRTSTSSTVKVTVDGNQLVSEQDGVTYLDGEPVAEGVEIGETKDTDRNSWIKERVDNGTSRGDLAKMLDLSYGVIYGITKDQDGTRSRIMITLNDGTEVSRSEYIRMQFAAGVSRGDIAKELDVPYSVVWQATKTEKTDADRLEETIEALKTFADKVEQTELFGQVMSALSTITIKVEEPEEADEVPAAE